MGKKGEEGFPNLEKLIEAVGQPEHAGDPRIDDKALMAEFGTIRKIVEKSPYPNLRIPKPGRVSPHIVGPATPRPTRPPPGDDKAGVTGPAQSSRRCPLCKRRY